ncbi:MAG: ribosomal RNA small subunit methyltransferase A [Deltaproteobacteria bacterium RIFCSPHIGHO2_02_FULL_40_11]|nr:MAG: ribosomal RNA small subunit methyltransferase A [Deltaproteobacteria bacterium RIFCSPHIGHO2_02_FULL_40_11]
MNVKQVLQKYQLSFSSRLSQNFLHNENIADRIVERANIQAKDTVLEIGTGLGILTRALFKKKCHIVTFETDQKLLAHMPNLLGADMNVEVIQGDFLKFDLDTLKNRFEKIKVVANLPYHISTEILFRLFEYRTWIDSITVMLQKEVAQRMEAEPGSKTYGVLSVMTQLYTKPEICFTVSRGCFYPVPNVDSSVIHLKARKKLPIPEDLETLFIQTVKTAFQQRRKVVTNSLKHFVPPISFTQELQKCGIDPTRRIETFSMKELVTLTKAVRTVQTATLLHS